MNNIISVTIENEHEKDRLTVITDDTEYGKIMWRMVNGQLTCGTSHDPETWEPYNWLAMPPMGDAAIQLENDTAMLVTALFGLKDLVCRP